MGWGGVGWWVEVEVGELHKGKEMVFFFTTFIIIYGILRWLVAERGERGQFMIKFSWIARSLARSQGNLSQFVLMHTKHNIHTTLIQHSPLEYQKKIIGECQVAYAATSPNRNCAQLMEPSNSVNNCTALSPSAAPAATCTGNR